MERFVLPIFAVFGFLSALFMDTGEAPAVTQNSKSQIEYD